MGVKLSFPIMLISIEKPIKCKKKSKIKKHFSKKHPAIAFAGHF